MTRPGRMLRIGDGGGSGLQSVQMHSSAPCLAQARPPRPSHWHAIGSRDSGAGQGVRPSHCSACASAPLCGNHDFDLLCAGFGIEHRLAPPTRRRPTARSNASMDASRISRSATSSSLRDPESDRCVSALYSRKSCALRRETSSSRTSKSARRSPFTSARTSTFSPCCTYQTE